MNRTKYILLLVLFNFSFVMISSAMVEKRLIYNSYLLSDMSTWKKIIDDMHAEKGKSHQRELELLNYEYGYVGWCIGNKRKKEAKIYISRSLERIKRLETAKQHLPLFDAYTSAFYGFRIGLEPLRAPTFGPRSLEFAKKSVAKDNQNAMGYIQLGNIDYFMPPAFGGSKEKAIKNYLQAERLMDPISEYDWNYLALLVQIATVYSETGNLEKADFYYRKTLSISPNFIWVRDQLYPAFKKKHNKL